jgi:hypothetical protein
MTAMLALLTLLTAPAPSAAAHPAEPPCQTFTRESASAPPLVRAWFADSADERVLVCPQPGESGSEAPPLYFGEGAVQRHDQVCSYARHGLAVVGSGAAPRLRRIERSEAVAMALADGECPPPHAVAGSDAYVLTYDVSPRAFAAIIELWRKFSAPGPAPGPQQEPQVCCHLSAKSAATPGDTAAGATLKRLRAAAEDGRLGAGSLMRIVRLPGSALRRRYALFVKDPDKVKDRPGGQPGMFVIYLQKRLRGPYEVSDLGTSN